MKKLIQKLLFGKNWKKLAHNNAEPQGIAEKIIPEDYDESSCSAFFDSLRDYEQWKNSHRDSILQVPITKLSSLHEYHA